MENLHVFWIHVLCCFHMLQVPSDIFVDCLCFLLMVCFVKWIFLTLMKLKFVNLFFYSPFYALFKKPFLLMNFHRTALSVSHTCAGRRNTENLQGDTSKKKTGNRCSFFFRSIFLGRGKTHRICAKKKKPLCVSSFLCWTQNVRCKVSYFY